MHAPRNNKRSWRSRDEVAVDGLVVAGLTELALGALTGWPMAVAVSRPQDLGRLGIRSGARLRQWHLDLIMLGGRTAVRARSPAQGRRAAGDRRLGQRQRARRAGLPARAQGPPDVQDRRRRLVRVGLLGLRRPGRRRLETL